MGCLLQEHPMYILTSQRKNSDIRVWYYGLRIQYQIWLESCKKH